MGADGCGQVINVGEGIDSSVVGKKVSFFKGAWSRYTVKDANTVIYYQDDQEFDFRSAACAYVNPLTACGLLDFSR